MQQRSAFRVIQSIMPSHDANAMVGCNDMISCENCLWLSLSPVNVFLWDQSTEKYCLSNSPTSSSVSLFLCQSYQYISRWVGDDAKCIVVTSSCVSVSVPVRGRMPTLLHGPGYNLGEWKGMPPSCALLGGLQSGHGLCCYGNLTWMRNVSEYMLLLDIVASTDSPGCCNTCWKYLNFGILT